MKRMAWMAQTCVVAWRLASISAVTGTDVVKHCTVVVDEVGGIQQMAQEHHSKVRAIIDRSSYVM
ncbi:hypothetical protein KIPB_015249, partial [Kipferlia bialata]|eukprot:g15249.t1